MPLEISQAEGVARICFNGGKSNSLNRENLSELADGIREVSRNSSLRVIGLSSAGEGAFCAGASFDEMKALGDLGSAKAFFLGFAQVILALRDAPQFVLCRVQGRAVGGALGIIAACDAALASANAELRLSELSIGLAPLVVGPVVERKLGTAHFQNMAVDTQWRSADWAYQRGFYVSVWSTQAELDAAFDTELLRSAAYSADAVLAAKRMFWEAFPHSGESLESLFQRRAETVAQLALKKKF